MSDELTNAIDEYRAARGNANRLAGDYKRLRQATAEAYAAAEQAQQVRRKAEAKIWTLVEPDPDGVEYVV